VLQSGCDWRAGSKAGFARVLRRAADDDSSGRLPQRLGIFSSRPE